MNKTEAFQKYKKFCDEHGLKNPATFRKKLRDPKFCKEFEKALQDFHFSLGFRPFPWTANCFVSEK